jgi:hypothetical protein
MGALDHRPRRVPPAAQERIVNTPELFIIGAIVTAIVTLALGLVLYGAIMGQVGRSGVDLPRG